MATMDHPPQQDFWARLMPARAVPFAMLGVAALLYGIVPSANKLVGTAGVSPFAYAFWFSLCGAALAFVAALATGGRPRFSKAHVKAYLATGFFGISLPFIFLTLAAPHLPASVIALLLALVPAFTYLMTLLFRMDRFRTLSVGGLALGLLGVLALLFENGTEFGGDLKWLLLALLAPISFAVSNIMAVVFRPPQSPSMSLTFGLLIVAALVLAPLYVAGTPIYMPFPPTTGVDWTVIGMGALMMSFIYFFFEIIHRAGPVFFSQFNYLSLVAGVIWAGILFGERPSLAFAVALVLMLLGIILVNAGTRAAVKTAG